MNLIRNLFNVESVRLGGAGPVVGLGAAAALLGLAGQQGLAMLCAMGAVAAGFYAVARQRG